MDSASKVEALLKSFRERVERSKENVGTSSTCDNDVREPIASKLPATVHDKPSTNSLMEEFDQFVTYHDMAKKKNEIDQFVETGKSAELMSDKVHRELIDVRNTCNEVCNLTKTSELVNDGTNVASSSTEIPVLQGGVTSSNSVMVQDIVQELGMPIEEDSDEGEYSDDDVLSEDDEYLFPTPDEIGNARPPKEGMVFPTLEEAVRFVNVYGKLAGFAVIKGRNYKHRKITLQCNKSRSTRSSKSVHKKRKRDVLKRTNCQMNVIVKLKESEWHIVSCSLDHNHALVTSPTLTKFFLSHRTMSEEEILLSKLLQEIRVKPQRIMTIFRRLKGSFGNIMFGKKKIDNLKQAERKVKKNSDIEYTLKYMEKIQLDKPGFCSKMQVDSEGSVRSIFWTDGRSRMDYKLFGEIICFDTTYNTNKYNMPFAPIIGINGHAKTIVFGWALLKNQQSDTFRWLFESFVEIMGGKKPKLILTDQDQAMKKAIDLVFVDAFHRFCIWHILKNLRENMCAYMAEREGMEEEIIRLIMESLHILEFETGWKEMVETYDCAQHDHIKRMWDSKHMFVPAYFIGSLCPFTRSTGRSKSFNSNFKDYIIRKDSIENFLKQYELFQENVIEIENEDRFASMQM